ncbi:MAG TPA: MFS transporter, partial [Anaerolineaceae bacterium]
RVSPDPAAAARVQPASPLPAPKTEGSTAPSIWVQPYLGRTITLWVLWFALNFTFQGVFVWLPTLLIAGGNSLSRAYLLALVISLGQVPGTLLAAFLADRVSRRLSIAAFLVLWGISVFLFGLSAGPASLLFWGFLLAIWNGAAWGVAYPFTTELYPTRIRGAATGWASGFGRTGGILAPWLVGVLIQASSGSAVIFALLGAVPALTSLALAGLRQDTTGRALEEISDRSA